MRETVQVLCEGQQSSDGSIIRHSRMKASSINTEMGIWSLQKCQVVTTVVGNNIKSRLCSFVFLIFSVAPKQTSFQNHDDVSCCLRCCFYDHVLLRSFQHFSMIVINNISI
jgi:hypothetical protein